MNVKPDPALATAVLGHATQPNADFEPELPLDLVDDSSSADIDLIEPVGQQDAWSIGGTNSRRIRGANRPRIPFAAAANRVIAHGSGLGSERAPLSSMRIEDDRLIAGGRDFVLDREGVSRLAGHLRAPADYLMRVSPKLRSDLLAFHLQNVGRSSQGLNDANSRIVHRDGVFVDLGRSDLHTLGARQVLDAVSDGFGSDAASFEVQNLDIQNEAFCLDIVSPRISIEVRRGDEIQAGVRVEHSYTGERATTVFAFVVRLACTNGMTHRECVGSRQTARTRRLNADRPDAESLQFDQVRHLTAEVRKLLEPKLAAIRKLADERADMAQLRKFVRQARMHSTGLEKQLEVAWQEEGGEQTAFGLFNALTRLATHGVSLSARQRGMLARLAGVYANQSQHICPNCFSLLNASAS